MLETLQTLGSSAGGGFLGVVIGWIALKARLDTLESRIAVLVSEKECSARSAAITQRVDNAKERFTRIDANVEVIRQLLINDIKDRGNPPNKRGP